MVRCSQAVDVGALRDNILDTSRLLDGLMTNPDGRKGCRGSGSLGFLWVRSGLLFICGSGNIFEFGVTMICNTAASDRRASPPTKLEEPFFI